VAAKPPPWLTCFFRLRGTNAVASVAVVAGRITETADCLRKFKGQPWQNLDRWIKRLGGRT
jgi:hypothetical protein